MPRAQAASRGRRASRGVTVDGAGGASRWGSRRDSVGIGHRLPGVAAFTARPFEEKTFDRLQVEQEPPTGANVWKSSGYCFTAQPGDGNAQPLSGSTCRHE